MPADHDPTCTPSGLSRRRLWPWLLPLLGWLLAACSSEETPLSEQDLTPAERTYVQRLVTLERAKAVALNDRDRGGALLDSLSAAWGDSALPETRALVPADPTRSRLLYDYLLQVLIAEKDSLMDAPREDRLSAPLPVPPAPAAQEKAEE